MTRPLVQTGKFRGMHKQPLRNVVMYAPTIIWVEHGQKQLWWHESTRQYSPADWLVIPASHAITFVNEPSQVAFFSRTLSFLTPPPAEWLEGLPQAEISDEPRVTVTPQLAYCFDTLFDMAEKSLSRDAQYHFLMGFYAELKQQNALHLLFPAPKRLSGSVLPAIFVLTLASLTRLRPLPSISP